MSEGDLRRKRAADKQGSRGDDDRDAEEQFDTTPQIASAEVLATRKIVSVKRPVVAPDAAAATTAPAAGSAAPAPSPFGSVLGSFGAATAKVAPSPFANFGGAKTETTSTPTPFGFGFGAAAASAPATPAPQFSFGFGLPNTAPAATPAPAPAAAAAAEAPKFSFSGTTTKFDFSAAVNAFAAAKKATEESNANVEADGGDDNPEAEVPIDTSGPAILVATEQASGEEGEVTLAEASAKLFELSAADKQWHERGVGQLKVNAKAEGTSHNARVLMRDAKTRRALLNCRVDDTFRFGKREEKLFIFTAPNEAIATYLVKISGAKAADDTKAVLTAIDQHLPKKQ